ncbi:unnamed protein product [Citrullus colocynthis]|uniref:Uncharacterized protein n=1 Tax=Citrullus colocynthis TaxID=252529 RepID=A0ABP0YGI7_9ROSI
MGLHFSAAQTADDEKELRLFDSENSPRNVPIPPSGPSFSGSMDLDERRWSNSRKGRQIPPSEPNPRTSDSFPPPPSPQDA